MSPEQWLIAGLATLVLMFWGLLLWLGYLGKHERERIEAEIAPIEALPLHDARERAEAVLGSGSLFEVEPAPVPPESLDPGLPPAVRDLFSRFATIGVGESILDRKLVGPSSEHPGFLRIGSDIEFAEILVRPYQEPVFTLDSTPSPDISKESVPSAYHWLLLVAHDHIANGPTSPP